MKGTDGDQLTKLEENNAAEAQQRAGTGRSDPVFPSLSGVFDFIIKVLGVHGAETLTLKLEFQFHLLLAVCDLGQFPHLE